MRDRSPAARSRSSHGRHTSVRSPAAMPINKHSTEQLPLSTTERAPQVVPSQTGSSFTSRQVGSHNVLKQSPSAAAVQSNSIGSDSRQSDSTNSPVALSSGSSMDIAHTDSDASPAERLPCTQLNQSPARAPLSVSDPNNISSLAPTELPTWTEHSPLDLVFQRSPSAASNRSLPDDSSRVGHEQTVLGETYRTKGESSPEAGDATAAVHEHASEAAAIFENSSQPQLGRRYQASQRSQHTLQSTTPTQNVNQGNRDSPRLTDSHVPIPAFSRPTVFTVRGLSALEPVFATARSATLQRRLQRHPRQQHHLTAYSPRHHRAAADDIGARRLIPGNHDTQPPVRAPRRARMSDEPTFQCVISQPVEFAQPTQTHPPRADAHPGRTPRPRRGELTVKVQL